MPRPTYSAVMSTLAFLLALGGTSYAVAALPPHSVGAKQLKKGAVTAKAVKKDALTGAQIKEETLGQVPDAKTLAGQPAASFRVACPSDTVRAGDLCVETAIRPDAAFKTALTACAQAGRRVPDLGELALAYTVLPPLQVPQWTTTWYMDDNGATTGLNAVVASDDAARAIGLNSVAYTTPRAFRCVLSPLN